MLGIHAGQGAGDDYGPRFVACFMQAADDAQLPADPEFRASLRAYMEWAVRDVLSYAPYGSRVSDNLPVPRWSWSGLE
jgi:hemoglobin